jgi:hypothetical protein
MSDMHGKFVWIELMTSDPRAAEGFYSKVVGWSAKDSGQPGMSYTLLSMGETMMGGLMAIPEEAKIVRRSDQGQWRPDREWSDASARRAVDRAGDRPARRDVCAGGERALRPTQLRRRNSGEDRCFGLGTLIVTTAGYLVGRKLLRW